MRTIFTLMASTDEHLTVSSTRSLRVRAPESQNLARKKKKNTKTVQKQKKWKLHFLIVSSWSLFHVTSQGCWNLVSHLQPPAWLGGGPTWGSPEVSGTKAAHSTLSCSPEIKETLVSFLAFAVLLSLEHRDVGSQRFPEVSPQINVLLLIRKSETCKCSESEILYLSRGKFCKICCIPLQVAA